MSQEVERQGASGGAGAAPGAEPCRTVPLIPNFSICLSRNRLCPHALSFGHQYLCRHPDHDKFAAKDTSK